MNFLIQKIENLKILIHETLLILSMNFSSLLSLDAAPIKKPIIALFGGGGKTSMLYQLGREFAQQYSKVLLTSIVKAGPSPIFPIVLSKPETPIDNLFIDRHPLYLLKEIIRENKYQGFEPSELEPLLSSVDICVFEADGARDRPLKAHNEYDPGVPSFTSHVFILIGADVIDTQLNDGLVHRPDIFKSLWSKNDSTLINVELITEVVTSQKGYLSKIPGSIPKIYFVNKADVHPEKARLLGESISSSTSSPVFMGSVKNTWWELIS